MASAIRKASPAPQYLEISPEILRKIAWQARTSGHFGPLAVAVQISYIPEVYQVGDDSYEVWFHASIFVDTAGRGTKRIQPKEQLYSYLLEKTAKPECILVEFPRQLEMARFEVPYDPHLYFALKYAHEEVADPEYVTPLCAVVLDERKPKYIQIEFLGGNLMGKKKNHEHKPHAVSLEDRIEKAWAILFMLVVPALISVPLGFGEIFVAWAAIMMVFGLMVVGYIMVKTAFPNLSFGSAQQTVHNLAAYIADATAQDDQKDELISGIVWDAPATEDDYDGELGESDLATLLADQEQVYREGVNS